MLQQGMVFYSRHTWKNILRWFGRHDCETQTGTEETCFAYLYLFCSLCQKRVHTNNFEMCLGHFSFDFFGEIPHFLISNFFYKAHTGSEWRKVCRCAACWLPWKQECVLHKSTFSWRVWQELQIARGLFQPQSPVRCYWCFWLWWIQFRNDSSDLLLEEGCLFQ